MRPLLVAHHLEVRHRAVGPLLRRVAAAPPPVADVGNLWQLLHDELRLKDRIRRGDFLDRELAGVEHLRQFAGPDDPLLGAPMVVGPEEPALQQILAQPHGLGVGDPPGTDVARHEEGTREQLRVVQAHQVMVRFVAAPADPCAGQLREPDAEIALAERVVRAPAAAVSPRLVVDEAADDEIAVGELRRRHRPLNAEAAEAPELAQRQPRGREHQGTCRQDDQERRCRAADAHRASLSPRWPRRCRHRRASKRRASGSRSPAERARAAA